MSKHTEGPWHTGGIFDPLSANPRASVYGSTPEGKQSGPLIVPAIKLADARLIATAPDMLEALRAASGYMMNARIDLTTGTKKTAIATIDGGLKIINAAIAKAEGAE